mgnify:CR=1 FL=1
MIDINIWTDKFLKALDKTFPDRVYFVGLQGSYARGEATDNSDIDMVVILDELSADDIKIYNSMLDTLPHRELICGFLSGKEEILNGIFPEPSSEIILDKRAKKIKIREKKDLNLQKL